MCIIQTLDGWKMWTETVGLINTKVLNEGLAKVVKESKDREC